LQVEGKLTRFAVNGQLKIKSEITMSSQSTPPVAAPAKIYLGVDVAKAQLDLAASAVIDGLPTHIANQRPAINQLLRQLPARTQVICESTGAYHRTLLNACWQRGVAVTLTSPDRVRALAKSDGYHAKTDRLDALLLVRFGMEKQPAPTPAPRSVTVQLQELNTRRLQLLDLQTQEKNRRAQPALDKKAKASLRRVLACLQRELDKLTAQSNALIAADPLLAAKVKILVGVQGVGLITARALVATLPELGTVDRLRIASLAGLAPFVCQSGKFKGRSRIHGGRCAVRQALYMAARTAARCNPHLQPFYQRLRAKGKPFYLAITAVMRKLLLHLNAITAPEALAAAAKTP
jgi:transposase